MKVFIVALVAVVIREASCGAVSWPGASLPLSAPLYRTFAPHTKSFSYSTSQYIHGAPTTYTLAYNHPQFAYHIPQLSALHSFSPAYYPVSPPAYFPSNIFYPGIAGAAPSPVHYPALVPSTPAPPSEGDADTAVVDSAAFPPEGRPSTESPSQLSPGSAFPPAGTFPNFPQFPQNIQQFPQIGQVPSFPQFPQFPQLPSFPQSPTSPQSPSSPTSPPSSFPSAGNDNKEFNDEDTVSVESA